MPDFEVHYRFAFPESEYKIGVYYGKWFVIENLGLLLTEHDTWVDHQQSPDVPLRKFATKDEAREFIAWRKIQG